MSEKLLPCPFCGNSELFISIVSSHRATYVFCGKCDIAMSGDTPALATAAWNTRTVDRESAELYRQLSALSTRTATTYTGKTETFEEAVAWMKENSIKEIAFARAEAERQTVRALKAEAEVAELKQWHIERGQMIDQLIAENVVLKGSMTMMTDEQIKHMVNRFLGWKLPDTFMPDAGISFKPFFNEHTGQPQRHQPSGTNLFDAREADAMVRYMLEGLPAGPSGISQDKAEGRGDE